MGLDIRVLLTIAVLIASAGLACTTREQEVVTAPEAAAPHVVEAAAVEVVVEPPAEAAEELADDAPAIAAYPPPRIENVFVRRSGPMVELVARVARVRGARQYELQVAKTLMFEPLAAQGSAPTRVIRLGPMPPGMFFVHARALGAAGEGPFGDVRVVHANKPGLAKITALPDVPEPLILEPPIVGAVPPSVDPAPPIVAGAPPVVAASAPQPDPARLGPLRQRYEKLQKDLAAIEAVRRELQAKASALQVKLAGSNAKSAAALREELATLEATRAQLDREIANGLAELDRMLAASAP
jgi:hypothetical protein